MADSRNDEIFTEDGPVSQVTGHNHITEPENYDKIKIDFLNAIRSANIPLVDTFLKGQHQQKYNIANIIDAESKQTPLYLAVMLEDLEAGIKITELLLNNGADPNHKDNYRQSALYYICKDGKTDLFNLHMKAGAEVITVDVNNQTPLFYAAREGRTNLVKMIVEKGADVNHLDKWKESCIFYASSEGRYETCKYLIESGANVNQVDEMNQTALFFARKNKHQAVVDLLIENNAINTKNGKLPKKESKKGIDQFLVIEEKSKASSVTSNLTKRKHTKDKLKAHYRLVFTDELGETRHLTTEEFEEFRKTYPQISEMILDPSKIPANKLEEDPEGWESTAESIINSIWKLKGAHIFHKPVNPEKLGIPDYTTVIKKPMDLTTVKRKLKFNVYPNVKAWIADMELIFYNCSLYNGTESSVGKIGVGCNVEFKRLIELYRIEEKFRNMDAEQTVRPEKPQRDAPILKPLEAEKMIQEVSSVQQIQPVGAPVKQPSALKPVETTVVAPVETPKSHPVPAHEEQAQVINEPTQQLPL